MSRRIELRLSIPASFFAISFFSSSFICRAICTRWACGRRRRASIRSDSHGVASQRHILDQPQDRMRCSTSTLAARRYLRSSGPVSVLSKSFSEGIVAIRPPSQILRQSRDLVRESGDVVLAHVGQHVVGSSSPPWADADSYERDARAVDGLVQVRHLDQLVADVRAAATPL